MQKQAQEELYGYVERLTFRDPESGFTVAKFKVPRQRDLVCVVGHFAMIQPGETIRCWGRWYVDKKHGPQFRAERFQSSEPAEVEGIRRYLGSGLVKGIGPAYAKRIVDAFKKETLDIIDNHPEKLLTIEGIGPKRVEKIASCWQEQRAIRKVMVFLQGLQISPSYAQRIYKAYGDDSIQKVQENPYRLARDIHGIGFKSADKIAKEMSIPHDSPLRIEAGIEYVLSELSNQGNVCYPLSPFIQEAGQMLSVSQEQIDPLISQLQQGERIVVQERQLNGSSTPLVWLRPLYLAESGIAKEVHRLLTQPCALRKVDTKKAVEWAEERMYLRLAEKQKEAVAAALTHKFMILTGGPGTGKSTITKAILEVSEKLTQKIILAAPTGRAAKRMAEITRRHARTIHSLLEYDFKAGGFKKNRQNPLPCDLLIVDEASMIDTSLMNSLLKAVPNHARVILVGDIHQLPSVGPGNVLQDLITSECVPVSQLKEIFRQARGSRIITNAHRINEGLFPYIRPKETSDFFFIESEEKEEALQEILSLVQHRLPRKYGFDPVEDIQVLCPMKRGELGTESLNQALQSQLNPCSSPLIHWGRCFHPQDKIMQIRNNYNKEVFNGDIGRIVKIDQVDQEVLVDMSGKEVVYDFGELDELMLAYAVSVHKYQGSECPCVVMPVHTSHFKLLHRNLLYTGVTRGKKLVVLVGMKKALAIAVHNNEVRLRHTGLKEAVQKKYN